VTEARPAAGLLVSSLLRRIHSAGGNGAVLARGDPTAGAILLVLADRGAVRRIAERGLAPDGSYGWVTAGPRDIGDAEAVSDYITRRRRNDPDLWVVELDAAEEALAEFG
jgi:hypothetical protein